MGTDGFGTRYRHRGAGGQLDGEPLRVDFAANARSLGAHAFATSTLDGFREALEQAKNSDRVAVVVVETDSSVSVPGYESWWNVPVAEVSEMEAVIEARRRYEADRERTRCYVCAGQGES